MTAAAPDTGTADRGLVLEAGDLGWSLALDGHYWTSGIDAELSVRLAELVEDDTLALDTPVRVRDEVLTPLPLPAGVYTVADLLTAAHLARLTDGTLVTIDDAAPDARVHAMARELCLHRIEEDPADELRMTCTCGGFRYRQRVRSDGIVERVNDHAFERHVAVALSRLTPPGEGPVSSPSSRLEPRAGTSIPVLAAGDLALGPPTPPEVLRAFRDKVRARVDPRSLFGSAVEALIGEALEEQGEDPSV